MRSFVLFLWAGISRVSAETYFHDTKETTLVLPEKMSNVAAQHLKGRTLQVSSAQYRATWGTDHTGSCDMAGVPGVNISCTGPEATIGVISAPDEANCAVLSPFEIFCAGDVGQMIYTADFDCTGSDLGAVALMQEDTEDCLGGTTEGGAWVHGIQILLLCGEESRGIGRCDPTESLGLNNICSLGYSCELGGCTSTNLTIPNIASIIDGADAN
jgi:hypothetical protein